MVFLGSSPLLPDSITNPLEQQDPTFLAPGTGLMEDNFSMNWRGVGSWFPDDSNTLHLLHTLFLL